MLGRSDPVIHTMLVTSFRLTLSSAAAASGGPLQDHVGRQRTRFSDQASSFGGYATRARVENDTSSWSYPPPEGSLPGPRQSLSPAPLSNRR
jgi:hypothetical protein